MENAGDGTRDGTRKNADTEATHLCADSDDRVDADRGREAAKLR